MFKPCLVLDHDDTLVNSTGTVHWPCFTEYMHIFHPDFPEMSLDQYFLYNYNPGVVALFRDICGMDENEMKREQEYWRAYAEKHIPPSYPGIREILSEYRKAGGIICVVSHSYRHNILRDFEANGLPVPDLVYGWEYPPEQRKPSPWPVLRIMEEKHLSSDDLLVVDDLKPGYDMARAAGVRFAAARWSNDIPEIDSYLRRVSDVFFKTTGDLYRYLFEDDPITR